MKTIDIVKEAHIGRNVELTNIELTLIKTKWLKIAEGLSKMKRVDGDLAEDVTHFTALVDNLCGKDLLSLEETSDNLFSSEPIDEQAMNDIIEASTASYDDLDDEERARRKFDGSI